MSYCLHCGTKHTCVDNVPIFKYLTKEEKHKILGVANSRNYSKGEIIFSSEDYIEFLYVVNAGKVKLTKITPDGKEQVIRVLETGEFLGELMLFSKSTMNSTAIALEDTSLCVIKGTEINRIIRNNPEIALKFLEVLAERLKVAENMIEQIGIHDVQQRIAKSLLEIADNRTEFVLPFSKNDWASLIGTSRETLSRKLSFFQQEGYIKMTGQRKIVIIDALALSHIVE